MIKQTFTTNLTPTDEYPSSHIVRQLKQWIKNGVWKPNEKIPSEKQLAKEFQVCHATIKKALKELEREGLMWAHRGRGRFVSDLHSRTKTWTIGVILLHLEHLNNPTKSKLIEGINEILSQTPYHLNVYAINMSPIPSKHPENERWKDAVSPSVLDGAIIIPREMPLQMVEDLAMNIPVVWTDHNSVRKGLAGVKQDYVGASYRAVKHLIELGHRRIALINVNEEFVDSLRVWDGYRLALEHLSPSERAACTYIKAEDYTIAEGSRSVLELLNSDNRPTAIICCSNELTIGAYNAIQKAELKIPEDISLIGWNTKLVQSPDISIDLTSVEMNYLETGIAAGKRILELIDNPTDWFDSKFISSELIIGKSTRKIIAS